MKDRKFIIALLCIFAALLVIIYIAITSLKAIENPESNIGGFVSNVIATDVNKKPSKTIKGIIEDAGSKYISRTGSVITTINVEFKCDLYDENGKSNKSYFYDIIDELIEVINDSFYLKDESKNIEIYTAYDPATDTYKITINKLEDFYEETNGEDYVNLQSAQIAEQSDFTVLSPMFMNLSAKNMYYAGTELADENKVQLENGYYSYNDGTMYAKLGGGRLLNVILTTKFPEEIAYQTSVGDSLSDINERFSNLAFGSVEDGVLGYRSRRYYVFFYNDQASVYTYQYEANEYFDQYLKDYCDTGDLQKLYEDFTDGWDSYFEREYDPENGRLKLTFPTRGIDIDITNNDSRGIKIYNNYYLTDTVKELIKSHKITLEGGKDLIYLTEMARRETMR